MNTNKELDKFIAEAVMGLNIVGIHDGLPYTERTMSIGEFYGETEFHYKYIPSYSTNLVQALEGMAKFNKGTFSIFYFETDGKLWWLRHDVSKLNVKEGTNLSQAPKAICEAIKKEVEK